MNHIEDCTDLKSDESTKRAHHIVKNLDMNKIWDSYKDTNKFNQELQNCNFINAENDLISSIEEQKVETTTEENVLNSETNDLLDDSVQRKSFQDKNNELDFLKLRYV